MSSEVVPTEFCMLDLRELYESDTNPRRRFEGLDELTASVKEHGVLTPLLVRHRPHSMKIPGVPSALYQIIAGARRYRAARAAECSLVPVRIKEMTDQQAIELQIVENLQRRDVHPLDEAIGFQRLIELGQTVEQIAQRLSKSPSHVYQRMKLAQLTAEGQDLFFADKLTAGHAVQIARLNPKHQKEILLWMSRTDVSVRELADHIAENFHLQLKTAAFPTDDPELVPVAGSCKDCPKRSGANPLLFPDVKAKDTCSDPLCFHAKEVAFVKLQLERTPDAIPLVLRPSYQQRPKGEAVWTKTGGRKCESTGVGIVVKLEDRFEAEREKLKLGQEVQVCIDPKCKVHHPPNRDIQRSEANYEARTGRTRKAEKAAKLETKRQQAVFQALMLREPIEPNRQELQWMLAQVLDRMTHDSARLVCQAMGWEVKPDKYKQRNFQGAVEGKLKLHKDPLAILYALEIAEGMWANGTSYNDARNARTLEAAASRRGVNVAAIGKQIKEAAGKKPKAKGSDRKITEAAVKKAVKKAESPVFKRAKTKAAKKKKAA